MILNEPGRTHYDLSFYLFGFNVRVHPGFFILPFVFGAGFASDFNPGVAILTFILVFFVSILVHELGHSIAFRYYGIPSRIVLYWFGGLAIPESTWGSRRGLSSNQQIIVSLAGPIAGFMLAALVAIVVVLLGGRLVPIMDGIFPMLLPDFSTTSIFENDALVLFFHIALFCNIFWNILNLAPVFPLDGGQVAREIFQQMDYQNGIRNSLILAVVASAVLAIMGFATDHRMMGILFAVLGFSNYMTLQQMSGRGRGMW